MEQATTPSLEALKAYSSGIQAVEIKGPDAARPFFKRAIELDPNFAVAYAWLGIIATDALEPTLSVEYRTKAYELREHTSEAERYWVTVLYHKGVSGDIPKAIEACDLWIQAYPRSDAPHVYLGSAVLPIIGQYEREQSKNPPKEFVSVLTFPYPTLHAFARSPLLMASIKRTPPTHRPLNANYILPSSI